MRKLLEPGSCKAWHFLRPLHPGEGRYGPARGELTRKLLRLLQGPRSPGQFCAPARRRARRVLLPRSPLIDPWVSMATAGVRPRGGQPKWGRGVPEACAAALQCSPPWPVCSPSRCRLRCRGETRVKYSQGRLSCPSALVCTFLTRSGQLVPSKVSGPDPTYVSIRSC